MFKKASNSIESEKLRPRVMDLPLEDFKDISGRSNKEIENLFKKNTISWIEDAPGYIRVFLFKMEEIS